MRKDDGTVHFFVNGIDQGPAGTNVPPDVYGVIDLYGQTAQATIVDNSGKISSTIHRKSCYHDTMRAHVTNSLCYLLE